MLGIDQSSNEDSNKPVVAKAVTVEVSPDQAQAILLGDSVGTVSMSLRQISDQMALNRRVTTVADLGVFGVRGRRLTPDRSDAGSGATRPCRR